METLLIPDTKTADARALSSLDRAKEIAVVDVDSYATAGQFLVGLKAVEKEILDTFKEPKEKAWAAHKAITAAEKKHLEPVQNAEKIVKEKMAGWYAEDEKRREKEAAKAAKLAEKTGIAAPVVEAPKVEGVSMRSVWDFEITDAAKLPRKFTVPDETAIRKVVQALGLAAGIPGVRVFERKIVAGRA